MFSMSVQSAWTQLVGSADEDTLLFWGTVGLFNVVFYSFGLLLLSVDYFKRPAVLVRRICFYP